MIGGGRGKKMKRPVSLQTILSKSKSMSLPFPNTAPTSSPLKPDPPPLSLPPYLFPPFLSQVFDPLEFPFSTQVMTHIIISNSIIQILLVIIQVGKLLV